jgi:NAD(P)-dependent dehydrogenase (short-subunit alcohol dehydrogenase family)
MANNSKRVALVCGGPSTVVHKIVDALEASEFDTVAGGNDLSNAGCRAGIVAGVREKFGRLDVLVIEVPVGTAKGSDVLQTTDENFDLTQASIVKGPYFLAQAVARWMIEQRNENPEFRGVIVFLSAAAPIAAHDGLTEVAISKAGVSMVAQLWAHRLSGCGIAVFDVRAGGSCEAQGDAESPKRKTQLEAEMAHAVATLARGELPSATGNVVYIDSGQSLRIL